MKLLIGGKIRNIYNNKNGSVYYKSGGEKVDVSYMFKKNGGDLKKKYSESVKESSRIKNNIKFYGGNPIQLRFQAIKFNSDINTVTDNRKELLKLLQIAYNVVLERIITNRVNNVVDPNHKELLKGLLFALQYDLLKSDRDIVNEYNIKKKSEGGSLYYNEIENIFMHRDFNYWAIIEKLNNLIKKLLSFKKTNPKINAMFENIKSIIGEVSAKTSTVTNLVHIDQSVTNSVINDNSSSETDNEDVAIKSNEQLERQSRKELSQQVAGVFPASSENTSVVSQKQEQPQSQQQKQEQQLHPGRLPPLGIQAPSLEQPQQQLEQKQKQQQLKQQQQLHPGRLPPLGIQAPSLEQPQQQLEQKQKQQQLKQQQQQQLQQQLEQKLLILSNIEQNLIKLEKNFVQKITLDNANFSKSLDSAIKKKIKIIETIKAEIIKIQKIFLFYQSNKLDNVSNITSRVILAQEIVMQIKTNVKEGLVEKIKELKDKSLINSLEYNKNVESTGQLLAIINDTFKKIESIKKQLEEYLHETKN